MATETKTETEKQWSPEEYPKPRPNGMTDEQIAYALAAAGRRKNDPEYLKRWEEAAREGKRILDEEYLRYLDEEEKSK